MNIYYFPLISGGPRRSAKQLNSQGKLLSSVWDDLSVLYCTSGARGLFFTEAPGSFLSHHIAKEAHGAEKDTGELQLNSKCFHFFFLATWEEMKHQLKINKYDL